MPPPLRSCLTFWRPTVARMIPPRGPRDFTPASQEGIIFDALASLPDEFIVVHSMRMVTSLHDDLRENEADFIVFHREFGILCIEAKAGQVKYEAGEWRYGSGLLMPRGGPYNQASNAKYRLIDRFEQLRMRDTLKSCKLLHAVWFPSVRREALCGYCLPPEGDLKITLFADDLADPEPSIRRIFSLQTAGVATHLSENDEGRIISKVLCPELNLIPSKRISYDLAELTFIRLLHSQQRVLDFLSEQKSAVISGPAGSGKTLIAVERAKRAASSGDKVLFLCFNTMLKDDVAGRLAEFNRIDVKTIAGFAYEKCPTSPPDYEGLAEHLLALDENSFPYKHVVIDEGQDFGMAEIERSEVLDLLFDLVKKKDGSFYLFYDKNQFIQGSKLPDFLSQADCKLSLYVNCRNSVNIARCSYGALESNPGIETKATSIPGSAPKMIATTDIGKMVEFIDREISSLQSVGIDDIVILTCSSAAHSPLRENIVDEHWRGGKVPFYSCRRFKGLEADAVILVDINSDLWDDAESTGDYDSGDGLMFYTGASRAKHELRLVFDMSEPESLAVLEKLGIQAQRKPLRSLARRLNALIVPA